MKTMKTKYAQRYIGASNTLHFTCEPCEGEYLDTRVELNDFYLCTITFSDIQAFTSELNNTIAKYSI